MHEEACEHCGAPIEVCDPHEVDACERHVSHYLCAACHEVELSGKGAGMDPPLKEKENMYTDTKEKTLDIRVTEREFYSVQAAIRLMAFALRIPPPAIGADLDDIASGGGTVTPLTESELEELGDRLDGASYGENRLIVRAPRGSKRHEVKLGEVQIPDMWHLAMALRRLADHAETLDADGLDDLLAAVGHAMNFDAATLRYAAEQLLETWHLAHDLKMNLAGDV